MAADSVPFRDLVTVCSGWWGCVSTLQVRETLTKRAICRRLRRRHTRSNEAYLGGAGVMLRECRGAFDSPVSYGIAEWNKWYGRHCGSWRNVDTNTGAVTQTFPDHSLRSTAVPAASLGFYRQDVTFYRPGTCCNNAWTESGGTVSVSHTLSMAIETADLLAHHSAGSCGVGLGPQGLYKSLWLPGSNCGLALHIRLRRRLYSVADG